MNTSNGIEIFEKQNSFPSFKIMRYDTKTELSKMTKLYKEQIWEYLLFVVIKSRVVIESKTTSLNKKHTLSIRFSRR